MGMVGTQMLHGSTLEATDLAPLDIKARLIRAALWFVPRANPDYERLFPHVRKWFVEVDESGRVQREIGVASDGAPLFAAPDDRNLGFWTDSDKTFLKSELTPLAASEFEQLWMRARASTPSNALNGRRAKRAR
jgi:hypothetical protein